jgi:hypothetical protein
MRRARLQNKLNGLIGAESLWSAVMRRTRLQNKLNGLIGAESPLSDRCPSPPCRHPSAEIRLPPRLNSARFHTGRKILPLPALRILPIRNPQSAIVISISKR